MNKIYRVIWNTSLGIWMAVSELAKSNTKSKSQTVVFDTIQQYNNTTILVEKHLLNAHRNKLNLALATTTVFTLFVPSFAFSQDITEDLNVTGNLSVTGTVNGVDITALQNTVNDASTGLGSKASQASVDGLGTRVTATESKIGTLESIVNDASAGLGSKASQASVDGLGTRVTTTEGKIGTLESTVNDASTGLGSKASQAFVDGLDTRVNTAETNITALQNTVNGLGNNPITFAGDTGSTDKKLGEKLTVAGGNNITTSVSGDTLTVALDDNISVTSVTASGAIKGATLESTGNTKVGGALTVTGAATLNGGADLNNQKITNLAGATLAAGNKEAVTGGQLYTVNQNIANALGTTLDANGALTAPTYTVSNGQGGTESFGNVKDAIAYITGVDTGAGAGAGVGIKYFHTNSIKGDSQAKGTDSIAVGPEATANGVSSIAMGDKAQAYQANNVAIGTESAAIGLNSTAIGSTTGTTRTPELTKNANGRITAIDGLAVTTDPNTDGTSTNHITVINGTTVTTAQVNTLLDLLSSGANLALGTNSLALGTSNLATGASSMALGDSSKAVAEKAIAIGANGIASASQAIAMGANANATATDAVALGATASASRVATVALGRNATAATTGGISIGENAGVNSVQGTTNDRTDLIAIGRDSGQNVVGNRNIALGAGAGSNLSAGGTSSSDYNIAIGDNAGSNINGDDNIAIGKNANANVSQITESVAIGSNVNATTGSTVLGNKATVTDGQYATVVGYGAEVTGESGTALGRDTHASTNNVALGASSIANGTSSAAAYITGNTRTGGYNVVSVGQSGQERRITNLAAGAAATDAVNVSQLTTAQSNLANRIGGITVAADGTLSKIKITDTNNNTYEFDSVVDALGSITNGTISTLPANAVTYTTDGRISNIEAGTSAKDAVNLGQLQQAIADNGLHHISINSAETANKNNTGAAAAESLAIGGGVSTSNAATNSIAMGFHTSANAQNSVAIGNSETQANGVSSIAMGQNTKAKSINNIAMGTNASSNGTDSIAIGQNVQIDYTTATSNYAVGLGSESEVQNADQAIAIGRKSIVQGDNGNAIGNEALAAEAQATALGNHAQALLTNTNAIGNYALASGASSNAIGDRAEATYANATAIGTLAHAYAVGANALGNNANALVQDANAIGTNAKALDVNATAIGTGALASAENALANGTGATASAKGATALGNSATAKANSAVALGNSATASDEYAVALGNTATADKTNAVALGNYARAQGVAATALGNNALASSTNAVALGNSATVTHEGAVALGAGSTSGIAHATASSTINGKTYDYAGKTPTSTVSVGSEGQERQIINLAAGRVTATSTDAINGSQLFQTNEELNRVTKYTVDALGGGASLAADGILTAPSYTMTTNPSTGVTTTVNNVGAALTGLNTAVNQPLTFAGDSGSNVTRKLGSTVNVKGGANGALTDNNIGVVANGNDTLTVKLAEKIDLGTTGSVTTGNTKLDTNGVVISNPADTSKTVSITSGGINAGGNVISNVASGGTVGTNAANIADVKQASSKVTKGTNVASVTSTSDANGTTYTVNADGTSVSAAAGGGLNVTKGSKDASNVTDYVIDLSTATKADIQKGVDAKTATDKGLGFAVNGGTADKLALGDTVNFANGTNTTATYDAASNTYKYNLNDNIALSNTGSLTVGNSKIDNSGVQSGAIKLDAATGKITGVTAGEVSATSKDAVNGSQLQAVSDVANKGWKLTTDKVGSGTAAGTSVEQISPDETVTFVAGDNVAVEQAGGKITIATKKDVAFDKVTVGNVNIDSTTNKITGVEDGIVAAGSKDVVNGGQLNTTNSNVTIAKNAADAAQATADKGLGFAVNGGTADKLALGDTVNFANGTNTTATYDAASNTYKYNLNDNIALSNTGSLTVGNSKIDNSGVQSGAIKLDAATGKITGVTAGEVSATSKDAVNGSQLQAVSDVANKGWKLTTDKVGSGTAAGTSVEQISPDETVTFVAGDNVAVEQAGGKITIATKKDVAFDKVTVGNVNIDSTTNKITGVEDGIVAAGSKDVVNGGQLNTTNSNVTIAKNAADAAQATADKGLGFAVNGGTADKLALGDTVNFANGTNTTATYDAASNTYKYNLNDNIALSNTGSLTVGNSKIDNSGVQSGAIKLDAATGKITGVTAGEVSATSKDAVNGSQLQAVSDVANKGWKLTTDKVGSGTAAGTSVEQISPDETVTFVAGDNVAVEQAGGKITIATKKDVAFDKVTVGNVNIDSTTNKITGVEDGIVAAGSKDVVNGGQLNTTNSNVTIAKNAADAAQATADKGLGFAVNGGTADKLALGDTVNFANGTNTTATYDAASNTYKYNLNDNIALSNTGSLTVGNSKIDNSGVQSGAIKLDAATGKITGVTAGEVSATSKDAVNGSQLQAVSDVANKGWKLTTDKVGSGTAAGTSVEQISPDETVTFVAGDNVAVEQAGGKITIATKKDVAFDKVTVGNVNIDSTTNKITGVEDGIVAAGSKDVVNGGQLNTTNSNVTIAKNAADAAQATADKGLGFAVNGGTADKLALGDTVNFANGTNTTATYDAASNTYKYNLNDNIALSNTGSLTVGNSKIDNSGVQSGAIKLDAATGKITGVTAGTDSTDAVNVSQLQASSAAAKTEVKAGASGNVSVNADTTSADGHTIYTVDIDKDLDLTNTGSVTAGNTVLDNSGITLTGGNNGTVYLTNAGLDNGGNKIINVAKGDVNSTSTDAVNGSQLWTMGDSIASVVGGNTVVNPDGSLTANNIGGTGKNNIDDAIKQVAKDTANANAGWNLTTNGKNSSNVAPKDTVDFSGDGNVVISNDGNKVTASLADNVTIGSGVNAVNIDGKNGKVNIGDSTLNSDGLTIAGGPSVTKDGIDAAGNKVTNVGDGKIETGSKDAVNGGQIADIVSNINTDIANATAAATSKVEAGDNISVSESKNADGSTTYNVATKKDVSFDNVNVGDVSINKDKGINAGNKVISGVANGAVNKDSKEAINGSQLNTTNQAIVDYLGGGAGYDNITGSFTAPSYNVGDKKYNNVGSAIDALNQADQALNNKIDNVDQKLDNAFRVTNDRIDDVEKKANAGIAAAMALESAPYIPGKYTYAAGAAYHGGENAIGVTLRKTADNGRWSLTGGVAAASQGDPSVRIGISGVID
ncbi:ESPR-type extended signal peptide-containing protein [Acinetobacter wuhouensis]|nr:ESPR-type extended signal peptide-containing protein [Acinetobacter wuhouensis]